MRLRASRVGFALAFAFLLAAGALFALHVHSLATAGVAPRGAEGSGLWFFLLMLPWAFLLPEQVTGAAWWDDASYYVAWALVGWNALLIYCVFGGLTFAPHARAEVRRSSVTSR